MSINRHQYFVLMVDDATCHITIEFLKTKDQAAQKVKDYLTYCRDSLLYKGSEDNDGLGVEVTGCAWNKRTKTKTMMIATRRRVKGSMVAG